MQERDIIGYLAVLGVVNFAQKDYHFRANKDFLSAKFKHIYDYACIDIVKEQFDFKKRDRVLKRASELATRLANELKARCKGKSETYLMLTALCLTQVMRHERYFIYTDSASVLAISQFIDASFSEMVNPETKKMKHEFADECKTAFELVEIFHAGGYFRAIDKASFLP